MGAYSQMTKSQLGEELKSLMQEYAGYKSKGLKLDLSRGKPAREQLDLSLPMLDILGSKDSLTSEDGIDTRNYGGPDGILPAKKLMGEILGISPGNVFMGGGSSLNLMHDCMGIGFAHGYPGGNGGWHKEKAKFLCPAPGYDRHFSVSEHFGFELLPLPMNNDGPDMDRVEQLVQDSAVKGIWCVPKYQNPLGITFSDEVVMRLAALKPAAGDFKIFWDNAYTVHDLYPGRDEDTLLNLMGELEKTGNQDMVLMFASTAKITFAGGGISAVGGSDATMAYLKKHFSFQAINYDKVNMLRHVKFLPDLGAVRKHMQAHADILRPKFEAVLSILDLSLTKTEIAKWTKPKGGYFISLDVMDGCAGRTIELCKQAGVVMTGAGAAFPYGKDPADKNIRIAPSFAPLNEVEEAAGLLCLCAKIACAEKLIA